MILFNTGTNMKAAGDMVSHFASMLCLLMFHQVKIKSEQATQCTTIKSKKSYFLQTIYLK
jgi:hypothetical protein